MHVYTIDVLGGVATEIATNKKIYLKNLTEWERKTVHSNLEHMHKDTKKVNRDAIIESREITKRRVAYLLKKRQITNDKAKMLLWINDLTIRLYNAQVMDSQKIKTDDEDANATQKALWKIHPRGYINRAGKVLPNKVIGEKLLEIIDTP